MFVCKCVHFFLLTFLLLLDSVVHLSFLPSFLPCVLASFLPSFLPCFPLHFFRLHSKQSVSIIQHFFSLVIGSSEGRLTQPPSMFKLPQLEVANVSFSYKLNISCLRFYDDICILESKKLRYNFVEYDNIVWFLSSLMISYSNCQWSIFWILVNVTLQTKQKRSQLVHYHRLPHHHPLRLTWRHPIPTLDEHVQDDITECPIIMEVILDRLVWHVIDDNTNSHGHIHLI